MTDALERLVLPRYPRPEDVHPPLDSPEYRSTSLRHPKEPLIAVPQTLSELTGPLLGPGRIGELDHDLTRQHAEEPQGQRIIVYGQVLESATGDPSPTRSSRSGRPTRAAATATTATSTRRRWTRTSPAGGRTRHRRRGPLPVRHHQAGRLPVGQPPQRLAARAHPLLAVRPRVHPAAGDADVLPGRPAVPATTRSSTRCATRRRRERMIASFDLDDDRARLGARLPVGHRAARPRRRRPRGRRLMRRCSRRPRRRPSARSSRSGCPGPTARVVPERHARARSGSAAACSTAPASRSPTRWSRPGRPIPTGASTTPTTRAAAVARASAASAARADRRRGPLGVRTRQAGPRARTRRPRAGAPLDVSVFAARPARPRRRRGSTSPTRRPRTRRPGAGAPCPPTRRATLLAAAQARAATASTSALQGDRVRPSSSPSEPSDRWLRRGCSTASSRADACGRPSATPRWLQAMLDAEAALARAAARGAGSSPAADARRSPPRAARRASTPRRSASRRPRRGNPAVAAGAGAHGARARARPPATCTAARRARTSWTPRRCSSPAARWRRCSTTSRPPRPPARGWRAEHRGRRCSPAARCSSRRCR